MRKLLISFSLAAVIFCAALSAAIPLSPAANAAATVRDRTVTHFFTHGLIAYPQIAFQRNNPMSSSYDADCLTVTEFKRILTSLYARGYMLIDAADIYRPFKDGAVLRDFDFPADKKPLILSFDDVNYYVKKMHLGMNDRLIVHNGRLATFTRDAQQKINYDNENITVLENFIAKHPDFSYRGARGILCLTGFDGILGWRTQSGSPNRASQIEGAREVVRMLRAKGWRFACHSYAHRHMKKSAAEQFKTDTDKWLAEVAPLVGKTDLYVYPYGEWEIGSRDTLSDKHAYLIEKGFRFFFGVGARDFCSYLPYRGGQSLFMDRKPMDGLSLRIFEKTYAPYFDSRSVYDSAARNVSYPKMK